jgi:uncharacterized membrane protein
MAKRLFVPPQRDPRLTYRGEVAGRLDNLTDAVFGIAITLLIFNQVNPNSFSNLLSFTKTLPAFMVSISFVLLIWREHQRFSQVYSLEDGHLAIYNTFFIALVIFYVYPLRFLSLFLTNLFFDTHIAVSISGVQVPSLMVYYGLAAFALYFLLFLYYLRAFNNRNALELSDYEVFYTRFQLIKMLIMFGVPLLSVGMAIWLQRYSVLAGSLGGGLT